MPSGKRPRTHNSPTQVFSVASFLLLLTNSCHQILNTAPRLKSGAISHRAREREYWSDAVYMGAPFLAFASLVRGDPKLATLAVDQCRLYRAALRSDDTGTWRHIYSDDVGAFRDEGCWATGISLLASR